MQLIILANKYSTIFFTLEFLIKDFIDEPKIAHIHIDGKQTNGAVIATKAVAIKKLSSLEKMQLLLLTQQPMLWDL